MSNRPPATSAGASAAETFGASTPPPQPDGAGQIGSDATKILAQDGQSFGQGIGAKSLLAPGVSPIGGGGNVASDDPEVPSTLGKSTGNKTPPRAPATHASGGVIRGPIPPMGQSPTRSGRK
jgi:hypothetical protein